MATPNPLHCVQHLQHELVHARAEFADAVRELVIEDDRRDRRRKSRSRGDQRLRDSRRNRAQRRRARSAESMERVNDAPHRSEQSHERSDVCDRRQPLQVVRSSRVCSSEPAICIARCTGIVFFMPVVGLPPCRRYSSYPPSKTDTSGLGRNCSDTAATSCRRTALRNARRNRPLCMRARLYELHLDKITAHEIKLKEEG